MAYRNVDVRIGAIIRRRRQALGMTQEALGEAAGGISYQQIQKYETGANRVSVSRLALIAEALGTVGSALMVEMESEPAGEALREAA